MTVENKMENYHYFLLLSYILTFLTFHGNIFDYKITRAFWQIFGKYFLLDFDPHIELNLCNKENLSSKNQRPGNEKHSEWIENA